MEEDLLLVGLRPEFDRSVMYNSDMNGSSPNDGRAGSDDELRGAALELHSLARMLLRTARQDLERHLELHEAGIGALAYRVARLLYAREPLTISELSQQLGVSAPTLVAIVDSLEKKGIAARGRDSRDRRRIPLTLTAEGRAMIAHIPSVDEEDRLVQGLASLGTGKRRELLDLLRELTMAMGGDERQLRDLDTTVEPV